MFYFIDDDGEEDGEEEESDDDEDDDEDDGEMTLSDLYNKKLDDDEDGEDFVEGDEEEDDDSDRISIVRLHTHKIKKCKYNARLCIIIVQLVV